MQGGSAAWGAVTCSPVVSLAPPLLHAVAQVLQNARALCPCGLAQTMYCAVRPGGGRGVGRRTFAGFSADAPLRQPTARTHYRYPGLHDACRLQPVATMLWEGGSPLPPLRAGGVSLCSHRLPEMGMPFALGLGGIRAGPPRGGKARTAWGGGALTLRHAPGCFLHAACHSMHVADVLAPRGFSFFTPFWCGVFAVGAALDSPTGASFAAGL